MNRQVILSVECATCTTHTDLGKHYAELRTTLGDVSDAIAGMQLPNQLVGATPSELLAMVVENHVGNSLETAIRCMALAVDDGDDWPWAEEPMQALVGLVRDVCNTATMHPENTAMQEAVAKIRAISGNAIGGRVTA